MHRLFINYHSRNKLIKKRKKIEKYCSFIRNVSSHADGCAMFMTIESK